MLVRIEMNVNNLLQLIPKTRYYINSVLVGHHCLNNDDNDNKHRHIWVNRNYGSLCSISPPAALKSSNTPCIICTPVANQIFVQLRTTHQNLQQNFYIFIYYKYMMALLYLCAGIVPVPGEIHTLKASDAELWWFFICVSINSCANNRDAADLRHHRARYYVTAMKCAQFQPTSLPAQKQ